MTALKAAYEQGHRDALEKFSATRGLKEIRKSFQAGDMARANRLAKTPGVLSPSNAYGSELADLGRGGEGLATIVAHPEHGISVRKLFDPAGSAYSPEFVKRKEELANLPGTAKVLGTGQSVQGTPIHFNELIAGRDVTEADRAAFLAAHARVSAAGQERGYHLADLRPPNAKVTPSGEVKFIDHAPMRPEEVRRDYANLPAYRLPVTDASMDSLFGETIARRSSTPAHLRSGHMGDATAALPTKAQRRARMQDREAYNTGAFKGHMLAGRATKPMQQPAIPQPLWSSPPGPQTAPTLNSAPNPSSIPPPLTGGGLSSMFPSSTPPPSLAPALPTVSGRVPRRAPVSPTDDTLHGVLPG